MSLRTDAYIAIRSNILSGNLPFEELISERVIAESYVEMSRTPVREALAVLMATGLLDQTPQRGVAVHRIDAREALRAIRLRMGMESVMAEEAAGLADPDLGELREATAAMIDASLQEDTRIEFMLADTRLHRELARLGGFRTSVTGLEGLRDQIHLFRLQQPLSLEGMQDVLAEHALLLEAIEAGDGPLAKQAIVAHLKATRRRIEDAETGEREPEGELAVSGGPGAARQIASA